MSDRETPTRTLGEDQWGRALGIEILEVTNALVRAALEAGPQHHQPYGILHGGVYASIVEAAASVGAGRLALSRGDAGVVGVSNHTDFLRSHSRGRLDIEARPLHAGRRQHLWEVWIRRAADQQLVSRGQVRFQVLDVLPSDREGASIREPSGAA